MLTIVPLLLGEDFAKGNTFIMLVPIKVAIRSGLTTSFWHTNWTGLGYLRTLISGPLNRDESNLNVSDVCALHDWDFSIISFSLPPNTLNLILPIQLQRLDPQPDAIVLKSSPTSIFSSKSTWLLTKTLSVLLRLTIGNGFGKSKLIPEFLFSFGLLLKTD